MEKSGQIVKYGNAARLSLAFMRTCRWKGADVGSPFETVGQQQTRWSTSGLPELALAISIPKSGTAAIVLMPEFEQETLGACNADHELPSARRSIAFRAPSRSFVYTACRGLGSIIIFSQIKLTRPDRVSAVARSSPTPVWPEGTALLSIMRIASKTFCTRASTSSCTKEAMSSFELSRLSPSSLHTLSIAKRRRAAAPRGEASNVWLASS
jgi:hypothetical protein